MARTKSGAVICVSSNGGAYVMPSFTVNVYVRPSSDTSGRSSAKSGSGSRAPSSSVRAASYDSSVRSRQHLKTCQEICEYSSAGSNAWSTSAEMPMRRIPPACSSSSCGCCGCCASCWPQAAPTSAKTPTSAMLRKPLTLHSPLSVYPTNRSRFRSPPPLGRPVGSRGRPRIECVSQPVAHEVERQRGQEQEQPGEQHEPRGHGEDTAPGVRQHPSPRRDLLRDTHSEERERGLEDDVVRDDQRGVDDDRRHHVREDVPAHDPEVAGALRLRGLDELLLAKGQDLASHDTRDVRPAEEPDDHADEEQAGLQQAEQTALPAGATGGGQAHRQQQGGHRHHDVRHPGQEHVGLPPVVPRRDADPDPDHQGDPRREERHDEGRPGPVDHPDHDVSSHAVRPEEELEVDVGALRQSDVRGHLPEMRDVVGPVSDQRRDHWGTDRQQRHDGDDYDPGQGEAVPPETAPEQLPRASPGDLGAGRPTDLGRLLPDDRLCSDLGQTTPPSPSKRTILRRTSEFSNGLCDANSYPRKRDMRRGRMSTPPIVPMEPSAAARSPKAVTPSARTPAPDTSSGTGSAV